MTQEIMARIDALAAKLGVTSEYVWGILVKQAHVEAYSLIFAAAITGLLACVSGFAFRYAWKKLTDPKLSWSDKDTYRPVCAATVVPLVGLTTASLVNAYNAITPLLNPEYWALQQVLEVLKK